MEPGLLVEIAETAQLVRRAFDRRASPLGVTRAQWRALINLHRLPGLRQVDLADRLDMEPITLCRIIDRLEESELVERRRDPSDRRAWQLYLTAKAEPLVTQLTRLAAFMADDAFDGIAQSQREELAAALARIRDNLAKDGERKKSA